MTAREVTMEGSPGKHSLQKMPTSSSWANIQVKLLNLYMRSRISCMGCSCIPDTTHSSKPKEITSDEDIMSHQMMGHKNQLQKWHVLELMKWEVHSV